MTLNASNIIKIYLADNSAAPLCILLLGKKHRDVCTTRLVTTTAQLSFHIFPITPACFLSGVIHQLAESLYSG
jgi:hypothetical protein